MITLLAPKKIQTWDSFGRLFSDSSVIHLTYYILCFQCSSSDYLWYKVICSCERLVLRKCNWHWLSYRWRSCFHVKKNDTRFGTDRYRTDARANDSNQICGKERQARTSRGNDGSLWSRLPDHDAPGSGTDKGAQTGQFFLLGSHDSFCSRRRGGQQFGWVRALRRVGCWRPDGSTSHPRNPRIHWNRDQAQKICCSARCLCRQQLR